MREKEIEKYVKEDRVEIWNERWVERMSNGE